MTNKNINNNKEKAILFLRVSSKGQEDNYSLDAQEKLAKKYVEDHNFQIVKIWKYAETAWKEEKRENFSEMLEYVKKHKEIKHIVFDILDRMTRNDMDKLRIKDLIHNYNKTIHFTRTNKIYDRDSSPDDEFVMDIEVAVAKKMSNDISRKTKMGLNQKAEEGIYPGNAPTGYLNKAINNENIIVVDPINAPFIVMLFNKVASGSYSLEMLADELYVKGLRHKTRGTKINRSSLYRIIQNRFYYGVFEWKGKIYNGQHKPLISKELWEAANQKIKAGCRPHKQRHNFAFTNLLTCNDCGCMIGGEIQQGKHIYYRCRHHNDLKYLTEPVLSDKFFEIIKSITITSNIGNMIKKGVEILATEHENLDKSRLDTLKKDLAKNNKDLERLYEAKLANDISDREKEFYKKKETILLSNIEQLEQEVSKIGATKEDVLYTSDNMVKLLTNLDKLYAISDNFEKAKIIKFILEISKLTLDNKIIPNYRKPFDIFSEINSTLNDNGNSGNDNKESENKNDIGVKPDAVSYNFLLKNPFFLSSIRMLDQRVDDEI